MKEKNKIFIWKVYTYVYNLLYVGMEFMPLCLRTQILKFLMGRLEEPVNLIDYKTYFRYPSRISIGSHVAINRGCMFLASAHGKRREMDILIGNHCVFAPNVKLLSAGHDYHYIDLPDTHNKIVVDDYAWIGEGATILEGVKI